MARTSGIDPEVQEKMKFRALCRFRKIGRLAMEHAGWMNEEAFILPEISTKARDSIMQAFHIMHPKKKKILTFEDKALLCHPLTWRTDEDKNHLNRVLGGLKCFRRYPKKVRQALAAVSFFKYFGSRRVVIREGHEPLAMYFVISGELQTTKRSYDAVMEVWEDVNMERLIPGDVFGHDTLLHNLPRQETCTTLTACGLLCVMKEDFKNVLQSTIQDQWDEMANAMSRFTYFSTLNEIAIREGCMLAKMKSFKPDETILGDGKGVTNFVYFIISGECKMIETMFVSVKKQGKKTFYNLYTPKETVTDSNLLHSKDEALSVKSQAISTIREETELTEAELQNVDNLQDSKVIQDNEINATDTLPVEIETKKNANVETNKALDLLKEKRDTSNNKNNTSLLHSSANGGKHWDILSISSKSSKKSSMSSSKDSTGYTSSKLSAVKCFENLPKHVRVYFMQVCLLRAGGCFGLGETMKNRRMVAVEEVNCLLLPQHWLWQWNPANIWSRIKHFLDRKIPSTEKVFEEFALNQRWNDYKDSITKEVLRNKTAVNPTSIHDVSYSIRIDQNFDFGECKETKKKTKNINRIRAI